MTQDFSQGRHGWSQPAAASSATPPSPTSSVSSLLAPATSAPHPKPTPPLDLAHTLHKTRFLDDFPSVKEVPLQLPPEQLAAFESHIRPLLDLAESGSPAVPDKLLAPALRLLVTLMEDDPDDAYAVLRGVADYVQCTFAQVGARVRVGAVQNLQRSTCSRSSRTCA
jgi:hypothetical protein